MPKIGEVVRPRDLGQIFRDLVEVETVAEWANEFKESRKGNLWRSWDGMIVSVFRHKRSGRWAWSIADGDGPRFSAGTYGSPEAAMVALWEALEEYRL